MGVSSNESIPRRKALEILWREWYFWKGTPYVSILSKLFYRDGRVPPSPLTTWYERTRRITNSTRAILKGENQIRVGLIGAVLGVIGLFIAYLIKESEPSWTVTRGTSPQPYPSQPSSNPFITIIISGATLGFLGSVTILGILVIIFSFITWITFLLPYMLLALFIEATSRTARWLRFVLGGGRPTVTEVAEALHVAIPSIINQSTITQAPNPQQATNEVLISMLSSEKWEDMIISAIELEKRGGTVLPFIRNAGNNANSIRGQRNIKWVISAIASHSNSFINSVERRGFCSLCYVAYIPLSFSGFTIYCCRECYDTRNGIKAPQEVIAVLDSTMEEDSVWKGNVLKVNWIKRRKLFDFDKVLITNATDIDVELFCIQVGNDWDETRRLHYKRIPVFIAESCTLKRNSQNMLKDFFKSVELLPLSSEN